MRLKTELAAGVAVVVATLAVFMALQRTKSHTNINAPVAASATTPLLQINAEAQAPRPSSTPLPRVNAAPPASYAARMVASEKELDALEAKIVAAAHAISSYTLTKTLTREIPEKPASIDLTKLEAWRQGGKVLFRAELESSSEDASLFSGKILSAGDGGMRYTWVKKENEQRFIKQALDAQANLFPEQVFNQIRKAAAVRILADEKVNGDEAFAVEAAREKAIGGPREVYYFRKSDGMVVKIEYTDPATQFYAAVDTADIKTNVPLAPERFVLEPPQGVAVEDKTNATKLEAESAGQSDNAALALKAELDFFDVRTTNLRRGSTIKVGVFGSYYSATGPHWVRNPYGLGHVKVVQHFLSPEFDAYVIIEPGTENQEPVARNLATYGLTDKVINGFDAKELGKLDVIVTNYCRNQYKESIAAITEAV